MQCKRNVPKWVGSSWANAQRTLQVGKYWMQTVNGQRLPPIYEGAHKFTASTAVDTNEGCGMGTNS